MKKRVVQGIGIGGLSMFLFLSSCEKAMMVKTSESDPLAVFEESWKIMDERYAMFGIKGVDWKITHDNFVGQVKPGIGNDSLFAVIANMTQTLHDGHVTLIAGSDTAAFDGFYLGYPANFNFSNVVNNYIGSDYKTAGPLIYQVRDGLGYLYYRSFRDPLTEADVNTVLDAMVDTRGLIIDVRDNTGGNGENADRLASHFIAQSSLVKYDILKHGKNHDDLTAPRPHRLSPSGTFYGKPVAVLANRRCFSACNDFVLYMSSLPNVRVIGDQTGGGAGLPEDYRLVNGWTLRYSAGYDVSGLMTNVEAGIAPAQMVGNSSADETLGRDRILEAAIDFIAQ